MGHIDHGKSTLLDYIRKTNVVESEAGGITQHLSAYEVLHKDESGKDRKITFLDTPGHAAFEKMRLRGAEVADVAILVVSAEEGVKEQTLEALASIKAAGLPYVVAINKIDKPNANVERTKNNLLENEVYLEGLGGDISWVPVSAKTGAGVPELLDILLLTADLAELTGDSNKPAEGVVIETHLDQRRGVSATLVIRDGTLKSGMAVVSGKSMSPVRIFEDFQGKAIKEARFSSPVQIVGWNEMPNTGAAFASFKNKKEAEQMLTQIETSPAIQSSETEDEGEVPALPLIIKADVAGSLEAIEHELQKLPRERLMIKVIHKGIGTISENDVKIGSGTEGALIIGFHTSIDRGAHELAERAGVTIETFDIIYKLSEWLEEIMRQRTPQEEIEEVAGRAKILKTFSQQKNKQVVGGRVEVGSLTLKKQFRIIRQETEIGKGTITNLQKQRADVQEVQTGEEFGAELTSAIEIAPGDFIESFVITKR